jgi:hypothetical protein
MAASATPSLRRRRRAVPGGRVHRDGLRAPAPGATSVSLVLAVADTDAALARAERRGAHVERKPYEAHGSRSATIRDPFGHRWMLSGPVRGPIRPGDIGYVELRLAGYRPGGGLLRACAGLVLHDTGRAVTNTVEKIGLSAGGAARCSAATRWTTWWPRSRDRAAGGRVGAPRRFPVGDGIEAADAAGTRSGSTCLMPVSRVRCSTAPNPVNCPTSRIACPTRTVPGVLLPRAQVDVRAGARPGRLGGAGHAMAGVAGGAPHRSPHDVDGGRRRRRGAAGAGGGRNGRRRTQPTVLRRDGRECADDQGSRFYLGTDF